MSNLHAPTIQCWACGVLIAVPFINNEYCQAFRCGWCGAISEAADGQQRKQRRGLWHSVFRALNALSWAVVAIVLCLIASIILPGIGFVIPNVSAGAGSPSWLIHTAVTWLLSAGVLYNYFAAILCTPGTVRECCSDSIPAHYRLGTAAQDRAPQLQLHTSARDAPGSESRPEGREGLQNGESPLADSAQREACTGGDRAAEGRPSGAAALVLRSVSSGSGSSGSAGAAKSGPSAGAAATDGSGPAGDAGGGQEVQGKGAAAGKATEGGHGGGQAVPYMAYANLRYCWHCRGPKTPSAHHCRVCNACVVDLDHHCPFINNCVGRANLRNFISFMAWTVLAMVYCTAMAGSLMVSERQALRAAYMAAHTAGAADAAARAARAAAGTAATAMAAAAATVSRGAAGAAGGGGGNDVAGAPGWGSRFVASVVAFAMHLEAAVVFGLRFLTRLPVHVLVSCYIVVVSLGILVAVGALLAQTVRHLAGHGPHAGATCGGAPGGVGGGGGPLAEGASVSPLLPPHVHAAADAASSLYYEGTLWSRLHRVMCPNGPAPAVAATIPATVHSTSSRSCSRVCGPGLSALLGWAWPIWGPPPGVLVGGVEAGQPCCRAGPGVLGHTGAGTGAQEVANKPKVA